MKLLLLTLTLSYLAQPLLADDAVPAHQRDNHWYQDAKINLANKPSQASALPAKNVVLFIGDGMGISTVTAARILAGQQQGQSGEENLLSFERMPYTGLSKTYNVDAQTPDSAGTMTAIITGVKTDAGVVGVDENVIRGDCASMQGNTLVSALELAELAGKKTGIVTTTRVTHATPAATYAKAVDRDWEDNARLPPSAVKAGCEDIASQLISFETRLKQLYPQVSTVDGIDVVMGGGRRHFLPADPAFNSVDAVSAKEGDRTDGRNLIAQWQKQYPSGQYVMDTAGFNALTQTENKVLGLFNESHMHYEADRHNDKAGEPSLSQMTAKTIDILSQSASGYFLMVEAGRIDHAHHAGNAFNALNDTIELAHAVDVALNKTNPQDTLIIVTADHSHVFTMGGYPKRGNPILGKVINIGDDKPAKAADGKPYTTLGYANGLGYRNYGQETDADKSYAEAPVAGRHDLSNVDTTEAGFHQEVTVPLEWETHGGEDVSIYAIGPGAEMVQGVNEQNVIFHIINQAAKLEELANQHIHPE